MMRVFFAILGALAGVGTILTIRHFGVWAGMGSATWTAALFCLASLAHTVRGLRARVGMLEEGQRVLLPDLPGAPDDAPRITDSREAAELLRLAQQRHAEKDYGDARRLYGEVIAQFPITRQASLARRELAMLDRGAR
jgi:hypothetical protein